MVQTHSPPNIKFCRFSRHLRMYCVGIFECCYSANSPHFWHLSVLTPGPVAHARLAIAEKQASHALCPPPSDQFFKLLELKNQLRVLHSSRFGVVTQRASLGTPPSLNIPHTHDTRVADVLTYYSHRASAQQRAGPEVEGGHATVTGRSW
jgi:hypothetical protein